MCVRVCVCKGERQREQRGDRQIERAHSFRRGQRAKDRALCADVFGDLALSVMGFYLHGHNRTAKIGFLDTSGHSGAEWIPLMQQAELQLRSFVCVCVRERERA